MTDLTSVATTMGREATAKARAFAETNPVAKKAKDAMFTAIGAGVLGAQRATAAFKNVQSGVDAESLKTSVTEATTTLKRQAAWFDVQAVKAVKAIDEAVAPIEQKLPVAVRDAAHRAREARAKAHAMFSAKMSQFDDATKAPTKTTATKATATKSTATKAAATKATKVTKK